MKRARIFVIVSVGVTAFILMVVVVPTVLNIRARQSEAVIEQERMSTTDDFESNQPAIEPRSLEMTDDADVQTPVAGSMSIPDDIYFGVDNEKNGYSLINVATGSEKKIIEAGYAVVSGQWYEQFPKTLILQKDHELFAYSVGGGSYRKIPKLTLDDSEVPIVYPSLSESGKYFLKIERQRKLKDPGMIDYEVVGTRAYFFDAASLTTTSADLSVTGFSADCYAYDSLHSRFYSWACGEGIGNALPLREYSISDKSTKTLIDAGSFGLDEDEVYRISMTYRNGKFFAVPGSPEAFTKIIVFDPRKSDSKKTFTVRSDIRKEYGNTSPYSAAIASDGRAILIGQGQSLLILRVSDDGEIVSADSLQEPAVYMNFLYTDGNFAYYLNHDKNQVRVVDIRAGSIVKSIAVDANDSELQLFRIPR